MAKLFQACQNKLTLVCEFINAKACHKGGVFDSCDDLREYGGGYFFDGLGEDDFI